MNLNISKWKPFKVGKVFNCSVTKPIDINQAEIGNCPYITRSSINNGLSGYFANIDLINKGNCITIGAEGAVAFYQSQDFIAGIKVYTLRNPNLNYFNAMFLITVLNKMTYLYNYGRARILDKIIGEEIMLPVLLTEDCMPKLDENKQYSDSGYVPDFKFMEDYIKSLHHQPITTKNKKPIGFSCIDWKPFVFGNLITSKNIYKSKSYSKIEFETCNTPRECYVHFVSRTEENNSVDCYAFGNDFSDIEEGNAITVGDTTSTISYQSVSFVNGDHIIVIRADWLNKYTGMFIVSLLRKERYRYSYGRAFLMDSIKNTKLLLPVKKKNGKPVIDDSHTFSDEGYLPDWAWIENYIKSLPYSDRI